jgi:hypothetical protein
MKIVCHGPKEGRIWSISIPGSIGRKGIVSALGSLEGVSFIKEPNILSSLQDQPFCMFDFKGQRFFIEAEWPAFDSFEISPEPRGCKEQLIEIKDFLEKLDKS